MTVGTVSGLWRYPVKSMQGEALDACEVGTLGLEGDRAWALIDQENGKVVSAKSPRRWPNIFEYRAAYAAGPGGEVTVTCPDGRSVSSGAKEADATLSSALGRGVHLSRSAPARAEIESYTPDIEGLARRGLTSDSQIAYAAPGTFFDFSAVHLVTTSSLAALSAAYPRGQFDRRRFRPNLLIDTGDEPGFVENDWVGKTLAIGDSLRLQVVIPCPRCVMTTLPQGDLPSDPEILRTVARVNNVEIGGFSAKMPSVGVYATVASAGRVRVGDPVSAG
jgi:uncharacterized protein YcbX